MYLHPQILSGNGNLEPLTLSGELSFKLFPDYWDIFFTRVAKLGLQYKLKVDLSQGPVPLAYELPRRLRTDERVVVAATEWSNGSRSGGTSFALGRVVAGPDGKPVQPLQTGLHGRRHNSLYAGDRLVRVQCGWDKWTETAEIVAIEGSCQTDTWRGKQIVMMTLQQHMRRYGLRVIGGQPYGCIHVPWAKAVYAAFAMLCCRNYPCLTPHFDANLLGGPPANSRHHPP